MIRVGAVHPDPVGGDGIGTAIARGHEQDEGNREVAETHGELPEQCLRRGGPAIQLSPDAAMHRSQLDHTWLMLHLTALGGLTLGMEDGLVSGAMTQRRRLALLALLAVARQRGLSRDKIMAYLWPESAAQAARRSLNQLLYLQRKLLTGRELFLGGKTLRLNPTEIRTDVGEFEDALDRGALETAVDRYGGPFLDGFFLKDAPEFERWVDEQRHRLARRLCAAYVALANASAANAEQARSAAWWQRAAEVDPLDSQIALDVVQALDAAGNRGGALRHAQQHSQRLREELGVAPDPRLVQLMERLRVGA